MQKWILSINLEDSKYASEYPGIIWRCSFTCFRKQVNEKVSVFHF